MRAALVLVVFSAACDQKAAPAPSSSAGAGSSVAPATTPRPEQTGPDEYYAQRCFVCHGKDGRGDGPGAVALRPKPRSLADAEWQKSVTDEQIEQVIVGGGAAIGKSTAMPAQRDLENKPELLRGLVKKVRSFSR